jgi:hypothetical protein
VAYQHPRILFTNKTIKKAILQILFSLKRKYFYQFDTAIIMRIHRDHLPS